MEDWELHSGVHPALVGTHSTRAPAPCYRNMHFTSGLLLFVRRLFQRLSAGFPDIFKVCWRLHIAACTACCNGGREGMKGHP